jgi:fermentation-respiration switch protein FrsA (DUF1100 family)
MWSLLASVAAAYLAVLVLVYVFQSRLIYFPEVGRAVTATPQAYGLAFEPVTITTEDNERLAAWWVPAEGALGAVLFFHGNAGNISHRLDYLAMFNRLRYSTLIVDYRGYGQSTGSPSEDGTYRDAVASWNYLRTARGIKGEDVVLAGESLGGAVAAWLAARVSLTPDPSPERRGEISASLLPPGEGARTRGPRALVLASTLTSVPDLGAQIYPFLPVRWLSRFSYDSLAAVRSVRSPLLVAHSRADEIVPYAHGRKLFEAGNEPKEFLDLDGGHNEGFLFARREWVEAVGAFLERAAKK